MVAELNRTIIAGVDRQRESLNRLSRRIHAHPELGFQEVHATAWLCDYLAENGFSVERGICEMPTAFRSSYGHGKPVVALLAEYDALPEVGHACGHNIICTAAVGAVIAAKSVADRFSGTVTVIGTPAEELLGGKIPMIERGAFLNVDIAMLVHPGVVDTATTYALACQGLDIEYFGKAAHAAANPEQGANALEAILLAFNGINSLRQHIRQTARIHGIITDGGHAANVVPQHSAGNFLVRAEDDTYLEKIKGQVLDCFKGAAQATGTRLEYRWATTRYAAMRNNFTLARLYQKNMQSLGRTVLLTEGQKSLGSTDMGNVSQVVPSIHPFIAIAPPEVAVHSPEFAAAAASEAGFKGLLDAAKGMALTVADLLADGELVKQIKAEFGQ